jgi:hypothetical protein
MRSILFVALTLLTTACSDEPGGMLTLQPDAFQIVVNQTTFLSAYLIDGTSNGSGAPVDVSYSMDPAGIVMLMPYMGIQKVTGEAVGNVVVTATGFGQTAKVGFTVLSP